MRRMISRGVCSEVLKLFGSEAPSETEKGKVETVWTQIKKKCTDKVSMRATSWVSMKSSDNELR